MLETCVNLCCSKQFTDLSEQNKIENKKKNICQLKSVKGKPSISFRKNLSKKNQFNFHTDCKCFCLQDSDLERRINS